MGQRPGEGQVRASGGLQGQNGQREGEYFREGGYQALPKLHKIRSQISVLRASRALEMGGAQGLDTS